MVRGEMPIEPGASWFSPKCVEAQRLELSSGGKALFRCGRRDLYQIETNSEYHGESLASETVGDKLHRRKGNSPDHQLRSLSED